jgi:two-component SAPR family response regulator
MDPADSQGMPNDVLIVEDDAIIALDFEDTILGFGVKSVRTCGNAARALQLIADRAPDFALLDVSLANGNSFEVAEKLQAMKIPFVFITGYGSRVGLPAALRGTPALPKPCTSDALEAALRQRARRG